jgi:hypothetical protein
MVLHRTASSEPEPWLEEIMARLLLVEKQNEKQNEKIAEQNKRITELETELSTTRQASIGVCLPSSLFSFFPTHPSFFRPFIGSNCDQQIRQRILLDLARDKLAILYTGHQV